MSRERRHEPVASFTRAQLDSMKSTMEERGDEITRLRAEVARLTRRTEELEAALRECRDLFTDIRGDWTDPRSACRAGWAAIDRALSGAAPTEGGTTT